MIPTCWYCGNRINQRTNNSQMQTFSTGVQDQDVGKHLLFNHLSFCSKNCILFFKSQKTHPILCPNADMYLDRWKQERKLNVQ